MVEQENVSEQANNTAVDRNPAFKEQLANVTAPSPSIEESISAYIERTVATLEEQVDSSPVTFLPSNPVEDSTSHDVEASPKFSESGAMTKVMNALDPPVQEHAYEDEQDGLVSQVSSGVPKTDYFQTDTNDVGKLFDSWCRDASQPDNIYVPGSGSGSNPEAVSPPESGIEEVASNNPRPCSPRKHLLTSFGVRENSDPKVFD